MTSPFYVREYSPPFHEDIFMHIDMNNFELRTRPNILSSQINAILNSPAPGQTTARMGYATPRTPILAVGDSISVSGWTGGATDYNCVGRVSAIINATTIDYTFNGGGQGPLFVVFGNATKRMSRVDEDGALNIFGDLSGNGHNLIQPKAAGGWAFGSQGGRQTFESISVFSWLLTDQFVLPQPFTITMTLKQMSDFVPRIQYSDQNPSNIFARGSAFATTVIDAGVQLINGTVGSAYHSEVIRYDGVNSRIISSSAVTKDGNAGTNGITEGLIFNANSLGVSGDNIGIAEIIIHDVGLTNDEMAIMLGQQRGKWVT